MSIKQCTSTITHYVGENDMGDCLLWPASHLVHDGSCAAAAAAAAAATAQRDDVSFNLSTYEDSSGVADRRLANTHSGMLQVRFAAGDRIRWDNTSVFASAS